MCVKHLFIHFYVFELFVLQSFQKQFQSDIKHFKQLSSQDQLNEFTVNIFQKCLSGKSSQNVLIGNWTKNDDTALRDIFSHSLPVYIIKNYIDLNDKNLKYKYVNYYKDVPGNNFIIFASSNHEVSLSLKILKRTIWWNHDGFFLIINNYHPDCWNIANSSLRILWDFNILSGIFVCQHGNTKIKIYTFNPYINIAPKFWNAVQQDDNSWTLFESLIENSSDLSYTTICKNINYEKNRDLNGYILTMGAYVHSNLLLYNANKTGVKKFEGVNGDIVNTICEHLNTTVHIKFYEEMGWIDERGYHHSFLKDLQLGVIDFAMNMNILRNSWKQQTYPHETSGFCIVSLKDPVTFLEKFELAFTPQVWLILGSTLAATMIILKFLLKQSLQIAVFEFLRMLLNTTNLRVPPRDSVRRIFFLVTLVLTMITNSFFQSRLSSINVVPDTNPVIETFSDLINSKLPIYGTLNYKELMFDDTINDRYHRTNYPDCIKRLNKKNKVACIPGCIEAKFGAYESEQLHISKKPLRQFFMVFSTRGDWPLLRRFNKILRFMSEAGILRLFRTRESKFFCHQLEHRTAIKQITFQNMKFGFVVFTFGMFFGFSVLFVEFVMDCLAKRAETKPR